MTAATESTDDDRTEKSLVEGVAGSGGAAGAAGAAGGVAESSGELIKSKVSSTDIILGRGFGRDRPQGPASGALAGLLNIRSLDPAAAQQEQDQLKVEESSSRPLVAPIAELVAPSSSSPAMSLVDNLVTAKAPLAPVQQQLLQGWAGTSSSSALLPSSKSGGNGGGLASLLRVGTVSSPGPSSSSLASLLSIGGSSSTTSSSSSALLPSARSTAASASRGGLQLYSCRLPSTTAPTTVTEAAPRMPLPACLSEPDLISSDGAVTVVGSKSSSTLLVSGLVGTNATAAAADNSKPEIETLTLPPERWRPRGISIGPAFGQHQASTISVAVLASRAGEVSGGTAGGGSGGGGGGSAGTFCSIGGSAHEVSLFTFVVRRRGQWCDGDEMEEESKQGKERKGTRSLPTAAAGSGAAAAGGPAEAGGATDLRQILAAIARLEGSLGGRMDRIEGALRQQTARLDRLEFAVGAGKG